MSPPVMTLVRLAPLLLVLLVFPLLFPIILVAILVICSLKYLSRPGAAPKNSMPVPQELLPEPVNDVSPCPFDLFDLMLPEAQIHNGGPLPCALPPLIAEAFIALVQIVPNHRFGRSGDPDSPWAMFVQVVYEHFQDVWDPSHWHLQAEDLQATALVLYFALTTHRFPVGDIPPSGYRVMLENPMLLPHYDGWDLYDVPHPANGQVALVDILNRSRSPQNRNTNTPAATGLDALASAASSVPQLDPFSPAPSVLALPTDPPSPVEEGFEVPDVMDSAAFSVNPNAHAPCRVPAELSQKEQHLRDWESHVQQREERLRHHELSIRQKEQELKKAERRLQDAQRLHNTDRRNLSNNVKRQCEQHIRQALADVEVHFSGEQPQYPHVGHLSTFIQERIKGLVYKLVAAELEPPQPDDPNALYTLGDIHDAINQSDLLKNLYTGLWIHGRELTAYHEQLENREHQLNQRLAMAGQYGRL